jgi:mannan endo-1,4-beta-mannosidase
MTTFLAARLTHTRWRLAVILGVMFGVIAMLAGPGNPLTSAGGTRIGRAQAGAGFVGRQGTAFVRDAVPLRPIGVNFYSAAGDPAIFQCGPRQDDPDAQLDDYFRRIRSETGSTVVRFWAFQSYTGGGTDWRALDRVVRLAKAHGLLLIPVLENQWADCTLGGPRDAGWYAGRYREPDGGYPLAYEEYVRRVVTRYRDEPAILAWMLMNEAEAKRPDGTGDPDALYGFAEQMSRLVKELDPNHLVALGVIGGGQPGTAGASFERLHALPTLDLVTYHDYLADEVPLPGARLELAGFSQGQDWGWSNGPYTATVGRSWETVTYQLPAPTSGAADSAPRRVGVTMFGDFSGNLYLDEIQVGSRIYDFEDGTTQGWGVQGAATAEPTTDRAAAGAWSLRVRVSRPEQAVQIWLAAPPDLAPSTPLAARVFVETPGTAPRPNTLASALTTAVARDKPLLVGEAGLATCEAPSGFAVHTADARAARLDAKIDAFLRVGGAGYLVWAWNPTSSCSFAFSSGDPLNAVLSSWAARLAAP